MRGESRNSRLWRYAAIFFSIACVGLIIALIVSASAKPKGSNPGATSDPTSKALPCGGQGEEIDLSEPANPGPFHDLTASELSRLKDYLFRQPSLGLTPVSVLKINVSYLYAAELHLPHKMATLNFLDHGAPQPPRQARAIVFRGNKKPPVVEEYIVTLTEGAMSHRMLTSTTRRNPVPYEYRPLNAAEIVALERTIAAEIDRILGRLMKESYDANFTDCGDKCFTLYFSFLTSGVLGRANVRQLWISPVYMSEFYSLLPTDLWLLLDLSENDPSKYSVRQVVYANQTFDSLDALAQAYDRSQVTVTRMDFPSAGRNAFSTSYRRGSPVPATPRRPPRLVEPDGNRYGVRHQTVTYMQWSANVRMAVTSGPQLLDVRFGGERIAFEISMQEVDVLYSGFNPISRHADFLDGVQMLGPYCRSLVPEVDCPPTATFLDVTMLVDTADNPVSVKGAFCVFEQNTGVPLRRHVSPERYSGRFYYGLVDSVLVIRSIMYIYNYDYVIDFVLHQSGAMEVNARATGFLFPSFYMVEEEKYGFRLQEKILGNLHHHLFHFKADLDILGTSNRYETLDVVPEEVDNSRWTGLTGATKWQTRVHRDLKRTEAQAAFDYNFDKPKYHIVHNDRNRTQYGNPRAYRLKLDGMTKNLRPADAKNDAIYCWARHQLVVTKRKEEEWTSSCPYNQFASMDPIVNFTKYYADDDSIVDEDLVFWVTVGLHHIPHSEDLPMTPTPGDALTFALLPYNYFPECPAMASRDATRIELTPEGRALVETFGTPDETSCESHIPNIQEYLDDNPGRIFDVPATPP